MGSKYTKKIPEFVYFVGTLEPGDWKQGPYVNKPKGYKDSDERLLKFELTLVENTSKEDE